MQRWGRRVVLGSIACIGLAVAVAWAQPAPTKPKLERLKIAVAPLGWDTNFTWLQSRSGQLDKRPALEYLIGIDRTPERTSPSWPRNGKWRPMGRAGQFGCARA
jgi:hypothetical protein